MKLTHKHVGKKVAVVCKDECYIGYVEELFLTPSHGGNKTGLFVNIPGRFPINIKDFHHYGMEAYPVINEELIK